MILHQEQKVYFDFQYLITSMGRYHLFDPFPIFSQHTNKNHVNSSIFSKKVLIVTFKSNSQNKISTCLATFVYKHVSWVYNIAFVTYEVGNNGINLKWNLWPRVLLQLCHVLYSIMPIFTIMHILKNFDSLFKQFFSYIYNTYTILKIDLFRKQMSVFLNNVLHKLSQLFKSLYICVI
jgi:hypothetical protein